MRELPGKSAAAIVATVLASIVGGCDTESGPNSSGMTIVDSAGVDLIHYDRAGVEGVSALGMEELLRIGTRDGPEVTQFFRLSGAIERGGEIYLLDRGHSVVRVFSAEGTFLRSFGRDGDGPGEFRRPSAIEFLGDTLVVIGRRLNLLDTVGTLLATGPAQVVGENSFMLRAFPTEIGWLGQWMTSSDQSVPRGEPFRESVSIRHLDRATGEPNGHVLSYPRPVQRVSRGEFPFYVQPYFQPYPSHNVGLDGSVYFTPGDVYRIDVYDGVSGELVRRITADPAPAPVSSDLLDRAVNRDRQRVRDAPAGSETAMFGDVIEEKLALGVPDNLPVLGRMYISAAGWLLVNRLDLDPDPVTSAGDPTTWDLFDPDGHLVGRVRLEAETRVLRLTDDGFLAVVRDELDVQSFVKYRWS